MSDMKPEIAQLLRDLAGRVRGAILRPGDADFEGCGRVWNASITRRPAAIFQCADANEVSLALRTALEYRVPVTVRAGGHNPAGRALAQGALLLDLSRLRQVTVDARAQVATVQGGALWRDIDVAAAEHGLATTGGMISSTGVGGFTLGGGTGWLMRKYGLGIDNLLRAEVVLADGRMVHASSHEHADLFYALRGGGGGLGVVTSFEFKLHALQEVVAGVLIRPPTEAASALRVFRDFALQAPDDYCGMMVLTSAPPFPFLEAAWHGRPVVIQAVCWSGDPSAAQRALEPLRHGGKVLADHIGPMPYVKWQQLLDGSAPPGRTIYWKTANYKSLNDATVDAIARTVNQLPTPLTEIHVQHLGGAVARVPEAETAFSSRPTEFFVNLIGMAQSSDGFTSLRAGIRALYDQVIPEALPSLLPNFSNEDDGEVTARLGASQGARVQSIRRQYDPTGVFATSTR
jgi:hypothetical protein